MKKALIIALALLITCTFCLFGCNDQSREFNKRFNEAAECSFQMEYSDTATGSVTIFINCYIKDGTYAYRYSKSGYDNPALSYRQVFANGKQYEFEEVSVLGIWGGDYKITENVDPKSSKNFIYTYTSYIMSASYLTLFGGGESATVDGKECLKYLVTVNESILTYYFTKDDDTLIKFVLSSDEGVKTILYRNYKYSDIDASCFNIPVEGALDGYKETDKLVYEYVL